MVKISDPDDDNDDITDEDAIDISGCLTEEYDGEVNAGCLYWGQELEAFD